MKRSWRRKKRRKLSSLCVELKKRLMSKMFGRKILLFLLWRLLHRFKVKVWTKQYVKLSSSLFQGHRERVREDRMGAGKRRWSRACKRCFQYFTPGIPYDWSIFTVNVNADVNHFALHARRVKQTWKVCEILLHCTFWHEKQFLWQCQRRGEGRVLCGLSY